MEFGGRGARKPTRWRCPKGQDNYIHGRRLPCACLVFASALLVFCKAVQQPWEAVPSDEWTYREVVRVLDEWGAEAAVSVRESGGPGAPGIVDRLYWVHFLWISGPVQEAVMRVAQMQASREASPHHERFTYTHFDFYRSCRVWMIQQGAMGKFGYCAPAIQPIPVDENAVGLLIQGQILSEVIERYDGHQIEESFLRTSENKVMKAKNVYYGVERFVYRRSARGVERSLIRVEDLKRKGSSGIDAEHIPTRCLVFVDDFTDRYDIDSVILTFPDLIIGQWFSGFGVGQ